MVAAAVAAEPGPADGQFVPIPLRESQLGVVHGFHETAPDGVVPDRVEVAALRDDIEISARGRRGDVPLQVRARQAQHLGAQDRRVPLLAAGRIRAGEPARVRVVDLGPIGEVAAHRLPALVHLPGDLAEQVRVVERAGGRRLRRRGLRTDLARSREEPQPVALEGAAERERGLRVLEDVLILVEVLAVRVEVRVPVANVKGSGQVVAARLRDHVDHAAGGAAVARLEAACLEIDLLNRIEVHVDANGGGHRIGRIDAVDVVHVLATVEPKTCGLTEVVWTTLGAWASTA